MTILGIGIDVLEIVQLEKIVQEFGEKFYKRCFLESEILYSQKMRHSSKHFAVRLAAKEAVAKAFGVGIGSKLSWLDIEIQKRRNKAPQIRLHNQGLKLAKEKGVTEILVSLSHSKQFAIAQVILLVKN